MPAEMTLPWVESPFFSTLLPEMCVDEEERERAIRITPLFITTEEAL